MANVQKLPLADWLVEAIENSKGRVEDLHLLGFRLERLDLTKRVSSEDIRAIANAWQKACEGFPSVLVFDHQVFRRVLYDLREQEELVRSRTEAMLQAVVESSRRMREIVEGRK